MPPPPPGYPNQTPGNNPQGYEGWAPGYQPGYGVPYERTNGLAVASLVLGIVSFFFCWAGILTGIVAIVMGIVALNQIKTDASQKGKGLAIAGIVCGSLGVLIWGFSIIGVFLSGQ